MRIRSKLLLAMVVPLALLIVQIMVVNGFIRELQSAVNFISSAHTVIEADFEAAELVSSMRTDVKQLPSRYVADRDPAATEDDPLQTPWRELTTLVKFIGDSSAVRSVETSVVDAVTRAFSEATGQYEQTKAIAAGGEADLDTLFERAIFIDKALRDLSRALSVLAVELREQLQAAVDREREIHNRPIQAGVVVGGLAVVLLAAFAWLFAAYFVKPVRDLMDGAERVAQGNLAQSVPVRGRDELGVLAQSFNAMADQLKQSFATLETQNRELQRLDALKDEFLANTSHELRTPLNGIIGLAESLIDGATGRLSDVTNKNLNMIVSSGKRLASLVNDILDFSKLKNREIELQQKPLDIHALADVVLALSQPLIGSRPLKLVNKTPPDLPLVQADENRVQQIMHNLIGNAAKFTETGEITVSAEVEDQFLAVAIADTGIGIAEDKLERIFESFEQADGTTARAYGGTGLGLTVSRQLVELHGGEIRVTSKEGRGSCFTFSLPLAGEARDSVITTPPEPEKVAKTRAKKHSDEPADASAVAASAQTTADGDYSVLIVDDEPVNLQVLCNHLSLQNYTTMQAQNGPEALRLLSGGQRFDLVILDVMMPRMSGYEVCQKIRESLSASDLPVILLSAKDQVLDLVTGLRCGANDYLTKPITKEELLARIETQLNLKALIVKIQRKNTAFERFVPVEFLRHLGKEEVEDVALGDASKEELTVLFSDIRAFTGLSESLSPEENFRFLNTYLTYIGPVIERHGGFIDKYVGDAIMALFSAREGASADNAVQGAIGISAQLREYNAYLARTGRSAIATGIGIHTGPLVLGTIGFERRMDGTVIGDTVNLASRVEGLTKHYGIGIAITSTTLQCLDDPAAFLVREVDTVQVRGREGMVIIYEVFNDDVGLLRENKYQTLDRYHEALGLYKMRRWDEALQLFREIQSQLNDDTVISLYLERCESLQAQPPDVSWRGVTVL